MNWRVGVKRAFRLTGRVVAGILLALAVFIGVTLAFVVFTPVLTISHGQIQWLLHRVLPPSFSIELEDSVIHIERGAELFSKRIRFEAKELCLTSKEMRGCFKEGVAGLTLSWRNLRAFDWRPEIVEVDPVQVLGLRATYDGTQTSSGQGQENSAGKGGAFLKEVLENWLSKWRYAGSRLEAESLELKTADGEEIRLRFLIETYSSGGASLHLHEFSMKRQGIRATGRLDVFPQDTGARFETQAHATFPHSRSLRLAGKASLRDLETGDFDLRVHLRGFSALHEARVRGELRESRLKSRVSTKIAEIKPWIRALDLKDCDLRMNLRSKSGALRCASEGVRLRLAERGLVRDGESLTLSPEFELVVKRFAYTEDISADWLLRFRVEHRSLFGGEVDAEGNFTRDSHGRLDLSFSAKLNTAINRFQSLVRILRETPYAVPAPFNVLEGALGATAWVDWTKRDVRIRFEGKTDLKSRYQIARLNVSGGTRIDRLAKEEIPTVRVTAEISDLALAAPRLEITGIPALKPDSRFAPGALQEKEPSLEEGKKAALLQVRVKTSAPDAIRISTNLTKRPIPIGLDLHYRDLSGDRSRTTGWVMVGATPVEIFRRQGRIEELRFELAESGSPKVLGRLSTSVHHYDISIFIRGDVENPNVVLESEPPLERDQILSVLLFGRPLEDLGDLERSSVTDMEAAMANAALGLASLYYFANTPIESVTYDPNRQILTAQVGLGGGASVAFGKGSAGSVVGFEKRLSREFVFRSDVERLAASGAQTVSALIEWVKRF